MNKELLGATIITDESEYTFIFNRHSLLPYQQIDLNTYEVVDEYPKTLFSEIGLGYELATGGKITALFAK